MANSQLQMVASWEQQKEDKCARDFQLAQQNVELNKQKLSSLEQYKLDYLRQTQTKAAGGVTAMNFNQYQSFIGKLDRACEMQVGVLSQARLVADQRKTLWLAQQRKRKAVELLLEQKAQQARNKEERIEQSMLDELSLQKFIRQAN